MPLCWPRRRVHDAGTVRSSEVTLTRVLYRIDNDDSVEEVPSTTTFDEDLYEKRVEAWVEQQPAMLGEKLLVIGRQIALDAGRDVIDLLCVDTEGALVVVELKRDLIGGSTDLQALRYAALVSDWSQDDIRAQAEGYWESQQSEVDFTEAVEDLCGDDVELNNGQRLILIGRDIKPRLGTMVLWLRDQGVDVRVVAISLMKDGDQLYAQPQVVLPPPTQKALQAKVSIGSAKKPWATDGQAWHLEQKTGPDGRQIVEGLVAMIAEAVPDAEGPNWNQKLYVSWRFGTRVWLYLRTGAKQATLHLARAGVAPDAAAERLGFELFQDQAELAQKLALGSSVGASDSPYGESLRLIIKSPADIVGEKGGALQTLFRETWAEFTGQQLDAEGLSPHDHSGSPLEQSGP